MWHARMCLGGSCPKRDEGIGHDVTRQLSDHILAFGVFCLLLGSSLPGAWIREAVSIRRDRVVFPEATVYATVGPVSALILLQRRI